MALCALVVHLLVVLVLSWEEPKTWEVVPDGIVPKVYIVYPWLHAPGDWFHREVLYQGNEIPQNPSWCRLPLGALLLTWART